MDIKRSAGKPVRKYKTNDPFKLDDRLNIIARYDDLGNTCEYFITYKRTRIIHIKNNNIEQWRQHYTCAYEPAILFYIKASPTYSFSIPLIYTAIITIYNKYLYRIKVSGKYLY